MADNFKTGDIVQLKSGGPKMTVTNVHDRNLNTVWFAGSKKEAGSFPFDAVIIYQDENKP